MVLVQVLSLRQTTIMEVHKKSNKINNINLKLLLLINDPSKFTLAHLFFMTVIKIEKFSLLEYLELFKSHLTASLVILVATSYFIYKISMCLL